ncbi:hypothetical protein PIB30_031460 [Stylosanthes scabra]|uniref:PB1-like domain-containing protein n=1 Tax=Stylosanthes scabra TaxID=79078 RepID=A0ABU6TBM2_9FABA|nr:hypothetical protein [Stylosanthes scabra]
MYHQGRFKHERGALNYLEGKITLVDYCNEDEWSLIEVYDIVTKQGYLNEDIANMWYKSTKEGKGEGVRKLRNDKDAMAMASIGVKEDLVELYVVHNHRDIQEESRDVQLDGNATTNVENNEPEVKEDGLNSDVLEEEDECSDASEDKDYESKHEEGESDDDSWSDDSSDGAAEDIANEVDFGDSDDDKEGAGGLYEVHISCYNMNQLGPSQLSQNKDEPKVEIRKDKGKEKIPLGFGDEEEGYDSEDFLDMPISDDEDEVPKKKYPRHIQLKNMSEYTWEVGTLYVSREEFKDCVVAYAVHTGTGLKFDKVNQRRVKVKCVDGCK